MNTKLIMTISAIFMAITGTVLLFGPQEVWKYMSETPSTSFSDVILQLCGALYIGFAMINWTAKANLIGGIYGRPIAVGNLSHFLIGSLILIKSYSATHGSFLLVGASVYGAFAISYSIIFFRSPVRDNTHN